MKKFFKNIVFTIVFVSVISFIGISKVKAFHYCGNSTFGSSFTTSGSYACAQDYSNAPNNYVGNLKTLITAWGNGWGNLWSKALAAPTNFDSYFSWNTSQPCSLINGTDCGVDYSNYDFSSFPVDSSSVAYSSEPVSAEIGVPYYGGSGVNATRMNNYKFENNLGKTIEAGTHVIKFYFAIGDLTDSDWSDINRVTDAFAFSSSTIDTVWVGSNERQLVMSSNSSSNTSENLPYTPSGVTVNSITTTWYGFNSNDVPYIDDTGYPIRGHWFVAEVDFKITTDTSFSMFGFYYKAHNQTYWSSGHSFEENLLFAGAYVEENIFIGLEQSVITLNSANSYSKVFSNLSPVGRIVFENVVRGNNDAVKIFPDLNGAVYYINSSSGEIFTAATSQIIPYKALYDADGKTVNYYYFDYDLPNSGYDGLAFISSGIATNIVGTAYQKNAYYCSTNFGGVGKKVCNFYARTPLLNKIITFQREHDKNNLEFIGDYNVKIWTSATFYESDLFYNSSTGAYYYNFNDGTNIYRVDADGTHKPNDILNNFDYSFISPTLIIARRDINNIVGRFTTGSYSTMFAFIITFFSTMLVVIILKAGVKH